MIIFIKSPNRHIQHQKKKYADYIAWDKDANKHEYTFKDKVYEIICRLNKDENTTLIKSLDIGCADGSFSKRLMEDFNFDVYGVDISEGQ